MLKSPSSKTLESSKSFHSEACQITNRLIMPKDVTSTSNDRSETDGGELIFLQPIIATKNDKDSNEAIPFLREKDSCLTVHLNDKTKSTIRQRSSKNTTVSCGNDVQIPDLGSQDATNNASHQFSLACKRLSHLMVCVSLYVILFSSSEIRVYFMGDNEQLNKHESQPRIHNKNLRKNR